jgi:hypothetical protein
MAPLELKHNVRVTHKRVDGRLTLVFDEGPQEERVLSASQLRHHDRHKTVPERLFT